ncbi:MAG TPA: HAD family hydrolase [Armatimonadota bacterium]|jgi:HAD superfamily hydrolase (TIGR01549 family)
MPEERDGGAGRIRWVFLDLGSVLLDEGAWIQLTHARALRELRTTLPSLSLREVKGCLEHPPPNTTALQALLSRYLLDPEERATLLAQIRESTAEAYYRLGTPVAGAREVLEELSGRYSLGILANQRPEAHDWLRRHDLADLFGVLGLSCDAGYSKPDPRLFAWALERAGCAPHEAVMVGDRPDNDIAPARRLGMATVRVRCLGEHTHQEPQTPDEQADVTVGSLAEVPEALARVAGEQGGDEPPRVRGLT